MKADEYKAAGASAPEAKQKGAIGNRRKLFWALISVFLAVCSVWAVASWGRGFSLRGYFASLSEADPGWMTAAVLAMLGYIVFEACALQCACKALRYPRKLGMCCRYAAADIYFSGITPSASGGQPACAFAMIRSGIPGIVAAAILLLTLTMYALAILTIGVLAFLFRPAVFRVFSTGSRILILVGFAAQIFLSLVFSMLLNSERLLKRICSWGIHLLARIRLIRNEEQRQERLRGKMEEYRQCAELLAGHRELLFQSFLFNLLQRASQITVTMCTYLAMGGSLRLAPDIFAMQSFVVLGSNCVPIPGAMGVADYLMVDGFRDFLQPAQVIHMELLSRSLSFYCCVLLCGIVVLISSWRLSARAKKKRIHSEKGYGI